VWVERGNGHVDNMAWFISPGVVALHRTDDTTDPQYSSSLTAPEVFKASVDAAGRGITGVDLGCCHLVGCSTLCVSGYGVCWYACTCVCVCVCMVCFGMRVWCVSVYASMRAWVFVCLCVCVRVCGCVYLRVRYCVSI